MELTGQSGHFWLEFEKSEDAQEWWLAMQGLNIAKTRTSFTPYVSTQTRVSPNPKAREPRSDLSPSSSMSMHVPIQQIVPNQSASSTHHSSSPPPIKSSHSSSTLLSQGSSIFCPRPTPPCNHQPVLSPRQGKAKDAKRKTRDVEAATLQNKKQPVDDKEVMDVFTCYEQKTERQRKISDISQRPHIQSTGMIISPEKLDKLISQRMQPMKAEMNELKSKVESLEESMRTEQSKNKNLKSRLENEVQARRQLETNIVKWQNEVNEKTMPHD